MWFTLQILTRVQPRIHCEGQPLYTDNHVPQVQQVRKRNLHPNRRYKQQGLDYATVNGDKKDLLGSKIYMALSSCACTFDQRLRDWTMWMVQSTRDRLPPASIVKETVDLSVNGVL